MSLTKLRKILGEKITSPVVNLLAKTPLSPSMVTCLGFAITLAAAVLVGGGNLIAAGVLVLVAGLFDMLDGALARRTDRVTPFGAVLDSTLDRLSEAALLIGVIVYFSDTEGALALALVGATLALSLVVSYLRAKTEAMGLEGRAGLFTRPERVIVLTLGLFLNQLVIALAIIAFFSLITVIQRLDNAWRQLKDK